MIYSEIPFFGLCYNDLGFYIGQKIGIMEPKWIFQPEEDFGNLWKEPSQSKEIALGQVCAFPLFLVFGNSVLGRFCGKRFGRSNLDVTSWRSQHESLAKRWKRLHPKCFFDRFGCRRRFESNNGKCESSQF